MIFFVYNIGMESKLISLRFDDETLEKYQMMADKIGLPLATFLKMIINLASDKVFESLIKQKMTFD